MGLSTEFELWEKGCRAIAGVDEVGRGPLAGPVVACACILPNGVVFEGVQDSKALTHFARKRLCDMLIANPAVHWALGIISCEIIDKINILQATLLAMRQAVEKLPLRPDFVLVDGRDCPDIDIPKKALIKGDTLSQSIAAASIIAKVYRDELMDRYHEEFPQYGFKKHKGYGTAAHLAAIRQHGLSPLHRRSFAPCRLNL